MKASSKLSRRDLFSRFLRSVRAPAALEAKRRQPERQVPEANELTAIIQGRFCLAYQETPCSVCSDHCPEPGAIVVEAGFPRVVNDLCTGCGICQEVCPAPRNAILMTPNRTMD